MASEFVAITCPECGHHIGACRVRDSYGDHHEDIGEMVVAGLRQGYGVLLCRTDTLELRSHRADCATGQRVVRAERDGLCVCLGCGAKQRLLTPPWEGPCQSCGSSRVYTPEEESDGNR